MSRSRKQKQQRALLKAKKNKKNKKNKKEKGKNMFGFNKNKTVYSYNKDVVPTTGDDMSTMSTVLFKQSTLDRIGQICLPAAGDSEFQVHYRALQVVISKPDITERVVVTIPTVFFNMPQKVSRASVDFNLDEVAAISEEVAPISEALAEKYMKAFPSEFFKSLGFTVEAREAEIGSMHRHPGNFGFSGTDLDNKAKNPGVIFRTVGAEDRIQVDSVMYIPQQKVNLYTTETRIIDVKPTEDQEGIEGTYLRSPTFSYIIDDELESFGFGSFFGRQQESKALDFIMDQDYTDDKYPEMEGIMVSFVETLASEEEYEPVLIIDEDLITEEVFTYGGYNANTGYHGGVQTPKWPASREITPVGNRAKVLEATERNTERFDGLGNYDGYDEFGEAQFDTVYQTPGEESDALETRPSWRKIQALGMLRRLGVDVNNEANITGCGTPKDIKAITKALEGTGATGEEIEQFFVNAAYTTTMMHNAYIDG